MFRSIPIWMAVLSAVSNTLASPLSSASHKRSAEASLFNRQIETGPGPECATIFCDLPACIGTPLCLNDKSKRNAAAALTTRQFECPPGDKDCGHGPECTPELCDLPGCADADVCTSTPSELLRRNAETDIVKPVCDICIVGANGVPVCGCATTTDGATSKERRDTEKVCPLFCIATEDEGELCGCAAEDYEESSDGGKAKF